MRVIEVTDPKAAFAQLENELSREPQWIVDGLFGIGLNRSLDENWKALIEKINSSGVRVLAIDVPSGLNADTGKPEGAAIRAEVTLTVGAPKRAMLDATEFVGRLDVAHGVGLVPCPTQSDLQWTIADDFKNVPPQRKVASHKGTYGHAALFAGSVGYHGAAVLMAHGAQRAQPGLVTVYPQDAVYLPVASQLQSAMVHPWIKDTDPVLPKTTSAIGSGTRFGCGRFSAAQQRFSAVPLANVVAAGCGGCERFIVARAGANVGKAVRVMTPHPGEAARLLGSSSAAVQSDRIGALRELSRRFHDCFVVLKGHQTLVGRSDGALYINSSGNAYLAQGGSGDALAGFITGLLAQPELQRDPLTTHALRRI